MLLRSHPQAPGGFPFVLPPPFKTGLCCATVLYCTGAFTSLVVAASFLRLPPLHVLPHRVLVKRSTRTTLALIRSPAQQVNKARSQQVNKARSSRRTRTCLLPTMFSGFRRLTPLKVTTVLLLLLCSTAHSTRRRRRPYFEKLEKQSKTQD